jgi:cytochrome oxidase Cu insertion factor (SCO1/SenC/PrrC family)
MNEQVSKEVRNKNRRSLIILVVIFILPVAIAWFVKENIDKFKPSGTSNFGQLVQPAIPLNEFSLKQADGTQFNLETTRGKWNIFYFTRNQCDQICVETISKIHQARLGQGKEMHRLHYYYINIDSQPLTAETAELLKPFKDLTLLSGETEAIKNLMGQFEATATKPGEAGRIYLIDPHANIMMTYNKEFVVRDLLKDLEHLLKYSQIG